VNFDFFKPQTSLKNYRQSLTGDSRTIDASNCARTPFCLWMLCVTSIDFLKQQAGVENRDRSGWITMILLIDLGCVSAWSNARCDDIPPHHGARTKEINLGGGPFSAPVQQR
jgi:hypothetical protein